MASKQKHKYEGVAALGDVEYDGDYDDWQDIKRVIGSLDEPVPLVRDHPDSDEIGYCYYFEMDDQSKELRMALDPDDLDAPLDDENAVSPRWVKNEDGKIVGIEHIAVGRFEPMCPKNICNVKKKVDRSMSEENKNEGKESDDGRNEGEQLSEKDMIQKVVAEKASEIEARLRKEFEEKYGGIEVKTDESEEAEEPEAEEEKTPESEPPKGKIKKKYINKNTEDVERTSGVSHGISVNAGAPKKSERSKLFG